MLQAYLIHVYLRHNSLHNVQLDAIKISKEIMNILVVEI